MSDEIAHLPLWVRRRDGSQVPFEADRICQALFAAAETLGNPSAFLMRELTDAVIHFLAQERWDAVPTTGQIADYVEKIVREVGQPDLARRFADQRRRQSAPAPLADKTIRVAVGASAATFVHDCLEAYALQAIFTPDVAGAVREGLLRLGTTESPAALASLVLDTPRLAELPWWLALDDWRAVGASHWIVDGPEWLCTAHMHPALTSHVCERLLALPTFGQRQVELHLNIADPPAWSLADPPRPLFTSDDEDAIRQERVNFLDGLLERWKVLNAPRTPAIAWHLHEQSFEDDIERRQLHGLLRQALQGKAIRFIFDRPRSVMTLGEGLDRKSPGVLLEVGLDLPAFAGRPDVASEGAALLKKLPSLARIAVSAVQQKLRFLKQLPPETALKRGFLLERASAVIVPLGLRDVVQSLTGACLTRSPLSLDFALEVLRTLRDTLRRESRSAHLDLRVDGGVNLSAQSLSADDAALPPRMQLEIAGKLHSAVGAGLATVVVAESDVDALAELLRWALRSTGVVRLQLQRSGIAMRQGELPI